MVTTAPLESLRDTIKIYLPDATPDQVGRFALQVERLKKLQDFFKDYPQEQEDFKDKLELAQKALKYEKPYRIAVIGKARTGKSTTINAILGRDLVLAKISGKPATGAALEIFFDVADAQQETAKVIYRDEANIRGLVADFVSRYKAYRLDESGLTGNLDAGYAIALEKLQPAIQLPDQANRDFKELRLSLADIVRQYANLGKELRENFSLANRREIEELMNLIDENSDINSPGSLNRRIGLVKSVTYHIVPSQNFDGIATLQLPKNVCLVDLPGLDGTPLHDIIISEGIKEADAVIFIQSPNGILTRGDGYLLDRSRKYISFEGNERAGERIFLVLNAKDSIMTDSPEKQNILRKQMGELMELLVSNYAINFSTRGGDRPYFETSSWIAYYVQKKLKGETIEDTNTYEAATLKLGVRGKSDREVLEASQIPKLVEELTKFAREHRIEGQIRDGKSALDSIIETLIDNFQKISQNINRRGTSYLAEKVEDILKQRQKEQEKLVKQIREIQEQRLENLRSELQKIAESICVQTDCAIKEKMPELWKKSFLDLEDRLTHSNIAKPIYEYILTEAQIDLWYELTHQVPSMANYLIRVYTDTVETSLIAEKISSGCYGYVEVSLLKSTIKEKIDANMRCTLPAIASRIAMTEMTDPACYFTAKSADGKPEKKQLFDSLAKIPRQPEVNSDSFSPFITEIRKLYESFVDQYCLLGLLNLYRYEMIVIEDLLLGYIKDIFSKMRYSDEPILKAKINESLSNDPNWKRLELLQRKLATLETIKS
jgi:Predicted GTPases